MLKKIILLILTIVSFEVEAQTPSTNTQTSAGCTTEITFNDTIGPAQLDQLERGLKITETKNCKSLMILINTPGGSLQTTRLIVEKILSSPVPILCLVHPSGGHAGSAGAIILQACHVNGAMEATNIGAATPVSSGGETIPEDLRKKLLNDTISWMEGITALRGRNQKFAKDIVESATAVSANEAKKMNAIDILVTKKQDFLTQAHGRKVKMAENKTEVVAVGDLLEIPTDLRTKTLSLITDPQFAYLMLMGSIALIYFEITHPGTFLPGILGAGGLIVSLVALHKLNVEWGGLLLVLLGVILLFAEAFLPGFGLLGLSGVAAFFVGSLFLFDPAKTGFDIPLYIIVLTTLITGGLMFGVAFLAFKTRNVKKQNTYDELLGQIGTVQTQEFIEVQGETWKYESQTPLETGEKVIIKGNKGLTLLVERKTP